MTIAFEEPSHLIFAPYKSVFLFLYIRVDNPVSCVAIITLRLSSLSGLLILPSFWGIVTIKCFLLPETPCLFIFGSVDSHMPSVKSRQQNRKLWEHNAYWRLSMLKLLYLAIFSLKVNLSRFPRIQPGGLKIFSCVTAISVVSGITRSDGNYTARYEVPTAPHLRWQQSWLTTRSHHFSVLPLSSESNS